MASTLDLIGDRWTLLVIRDLVLGKTRFDEFLASPERIATNILAARLKSLEKNGYVVGRKDADDRRRIHYALTEKGAAFRELLKGIARWGLRHLPGTAIPEEASRLLHRRAQSHARKRRGATG